MSTNRHLINDFDIVRPAQLLDKGLPLPGLSGRYVVEEGWCAVISEGGAFKEILPPGTHFLNKYSFWRDVKAIDVDTRIQTLTVSTLGEFTISQPVPVEINLELAVEYRVADPRRVAMEIKTPLTSLYDRVIQAVRSVIVHATYDEFRTQGEMIARTTLQRLQAMQLPKVLGVELFNVLVTSITGADAVAEQQIKEYTSVRDWQLDNQMLQMSQVTPQWLMVHRPEIYQQIVAGNVEVAKELIDKGLLDPAGFLNQPAGMDTANWTNLLGALGFGAPGFQQLPSGGQMGTGIGQQGPAQLPQFPTSTPDGTPPPSTSTEPTGGNLHSRIREELEYLQKMPKVQVEARAGQDETGLPDGTYSFKVDIERSTGGFVTLFLSCPVGFPQAVPTLEVELDGQEVNFQSAVLRRWDGKQYLVELVREVQQFYG